MPKVTAATLAVTGLLLIALTGCSAGADDAGGERTAPTATESATAEESAPLVSESPEATEADPTPGPIEYTPEPTAEADTGTGEDAYIASAQEYLSGWGYRSFTDDQVLSAGLYACESSNPDLIVIEGIDPLHNVEIVTRAHTILCP